MKMFFNLAACAFNRISKTWAWGATRDWNHWMSNFIWSSRCTCYIWCDGLWSHISIDLHECSTCILTQGSLWKYICINKLEDFLRLWFAVCKVPNSYLKQWCYIVRTIVKGNFHEYIQLKKMLLKVSSTKWEPFRFSLSKLRMNTVCFIEAHVIARNSLSPLQSEAIVTWSKDDIFDKIVSSANIQPFIFMCAEEAMPAPGLRDIYEAADPESPAFQPPVWLTYWSWKQLWMPYMRREAELHSWDLVTIVMIFTRTFICRQGACKHWSHSTMTNVKHGPLVWPVLWYDIVIAMEYDMISSLPWKQFPS